MDAAAWDPQGPPGALPLNFEIGSGQPARLWNRSSQVYREIENERFKSLTDFRWIQFSVLFSI